MDSCLVIIMFEDTPFSQACLTETDHSWNKEETIQYIRFIQTYIEEFNEDSSRRLKKTFVRMSNQIKSRDCDQCRSHHQKMMTFRGSIEEIIRHFSTVY